MLALGALGINRAFVGFCLGRGRGGNTLGFAVGGPGIGAAGASASMSISPVEGPGRARSGPEAEGGSGLVRDGSGSGDRFRLAAPFDLSECSSAGASAREEAGLLVPAMRICWGVKRLVASGV